MAEKKKPATKKAAKAVEIPILSESAPVEVPTKTVVSRDVKLMVENDYCRIAEHYDEFHESVYYVLTEKPDMGGCQRFEDWSDVEKYAKSRRFI